MDHLGHGAVECWPKGFFWSSPRLQTLRARSILCSKQATDRAGLADRKGSILAQFIALHLSRCRNFSTHFDWRRLAVSSSVFSHNTPASGVFRASSTELGRKTDPDDEGIVVPNQAATGFPAVEPHEGRIQTYSRGVARPYISPRWPSSPEPPSPRSACDSLTGAADSFRNGRLRQTLPPRVRHCLRASPERVTHALTWRNAMF